MKYSYILFLSLILFKLPSCQRHDMYQPGYNFELFANTPAYYLAKAVEKQDTSAISKFVQKDSVNVDFQEPKFGNTLLSLAIVNNRELSAAKLLQLGANPNLKSTNGSSPFLSACFNVNDLQNPGQTLLMLIKNGADVNSNQIDTTLDQFGKKKNYNSSALRIILAYGNLESLKVLIENGASLDSSLVNENSYVTTALLGDRLDMVKYLMVEQHLPIPEFCVIRQLGMKTEKKMTITDLLNEQDYSKNPKNQLLKKEIISFLTTQGKK